jgi:hypothetical protein
MLYTLQVYTLVTIMVFALSGALLLVLIAFSAAADYARALQAMRHIASGKRHEPFANSRMLSRDREMNFTKAS